MKMYDSIATINFAHTFMNRLSDKDKERFTEALTALFHKKQVSEEGEYKEFKITRQDVARIYEEMYGQTS